MIAHRTLPIMVCLAIAGCGGGAHDDLQEFMRTTGMDGKVKIDPLPAIKTVEQFEYQPGDLADPFMERSLRPTVSGGLQPDLDRPRQPLEEFPLDGLRLVGTMKKPRSPLRAIVKDPRGILHTVQVGNRIGQNNGIITAITEEGIEIKELIQSGSGEYAESKAVMSMAEVITK